MRNTYFIIAMKIGKGKLWKSINYIWDCDIQIIYVDKENKLLQGMALTLLTPKDFPSNALMIS